MAYTQMNHSQRKITERWKFEHPASSTVTHHSIKIRKYLTIGISM